uniref:Uncharacterized protein n=1 Tax=Fagus sylvatica TaxID=28930 RepID=A0A2N9GXA7_FAGSY
MLSWSVSWVEGGAVGLVVEGGAVGLDSDGALHQSRPRSRPDEAVDDEPDEGGAVGPSQTCYDGGFAGLLGLWVCGFAGFVGLLVCECVGFAMLLG